MVSIVTDSTADLSPELVQRANIHVIPYFVHHGEHAFRDGLDIDSDGVYRLVDETGELPKTAAPPSPTMWPPLTGPARSSLPASPRPCRPVSRTPAWPPSSSRPARCA